MKDSPQRPDEPGFAHARNAFEQHVSACNQSNDRPLDDLLLPYDVALDLLEDLLALLAELPDIFLCDHFLLPSLFNR